MQFGLEWARARIQAIESGAIDLHEKKTRVEWQLVLLLEDVVNALPKAMRQQARACIDAHKRLEEAIFEEIAARNAAWQAHKKTSSPSLATLS